MVSYCNPAVMFGMDRTHPQAQNYYPSYHHYPTAHHHPHHHQPGTATQNVPTEFNCNYPYQHHMSPETMAAAAAGWHQNSMYSACATTRNIVPNTHEDWSHHSYGHPHHPSFYPHQHPSPPNSTPSPSTTGTHSPNVFNPGTGFKTDFGPCSGGNSQENNSQELQSHNVASSGGSTLVPVGTPHSSDSGLPSSDVSAGSPNGHHHQVSSNIGSHQSNLHNHSGVSDMKINCNNLRPTQARSPYEWMKKTSYNSISNSTGLTGGKTRTKDKYRVVYSDTQRVELEKEFHFSKYITIRRKSELASILGLSERQVKIWFQNRRAKARKTQRKQEEQFQREKVATMIHMQNAAVLSGNMTSLNGPIGICNQSSEDLQYR